MSELKELTALGQSPWVDTIRRSLLASGELQRWIDAGLRGLTSNPTIFESAISGSSDYDEELRELAEAKRAVEDIYESLAVEDIRRSADLFRTIYEESDGRDGFVSLEASPRLAHDTEATIREVRRLHGQVERPNVMIKVPATPAGIPAIETLIGEGLNVNVTLMFSQSHYEGVVQAYLAGLERLAARGGDLSRTASVASLFVSRVDTKVDEELKKRGVTELRGKIAVANSKMVRARFQEVFRGERWEKLARQGARTQRLLWGSTSTKNPEYPDTLYVDELIGGDTVNTMKPETLAAFQDHGTAAPTLDRGWDEARRQLAELQRVGIDLHAITHELQDEGVERFNRSFDELLCSINQKRKELTEGWKTLTLNLGAYEKPVTEAGREIKKQRIMERIWEHDHTVWKDDPAEITNRLGWLHTVEPMKAQLHRLHDFAAAVRKDGITHAVLLGMGGSSLAPEVLRKTFGVAEGACDLSVLDTTDPAAIKATRDGLDPGRTLFLVSTKSGTTVETLSLFKFFFNCVAEGVGREKAGRHFAAITDPGSPLTDLAETYGFRDVFLNDPKIGGRYSALTYFGLVPGALIGLDLDQLLKRAAAMVCNCEGCNCPIEGDNLGARLGAVLGELARAGRDKATFVAGPGLESFGDWVEQLIAESTGKEGTGILPVIGEPLGPADVYGDDRFFVHLQLEDDPSGEAELDALRGAGHPVVQIALRDRYDLGGQFFLWEMATAVASHRLQIN
ncbi:MAG: bifunctional transaldolase/phosoglucose isomerase, partial [Candidatus Eisenbacteria bacterium]|nr:bifunctional transaldolase/phosoglucose isomerase [Candidatus Eisenbacteria bacterium]